MSMNKRIRIMRRGGVLAAWLGLVGCILLFLQPWKTCVEDDSSAGCPATMLEANLLAASFITVLLGTAMWIYSWQATQHQARDD
jgi:hypothetical protein